MADFIYKQVDITITSEGLFGYRDPATAERVEKPSLASAKKAIDAAVRPVTVTVLDQHGNRVEIIGRDKQARGYRCADGQERWRYDYREWSGPYAVDDLTERGLLELAHEANTMIERHNQERRELEQRRQAYLKTLPPFDYPAELAKAKARTGQPKEQTV